MNFKPPTSGGDSGSSTGSRRQQQQQEIMNKIQKGKIQKGRTHRKNSSNPRNQTQETHRKNHRRRHRKPINHFHFAIVFTSILHRFNISRLSPKIRRRPSKVMQRISSRLIQYRSWTRYNAPHWYARDRAHYEVRIRPPSGVDIATQEDRERWYKSFLEACKIDSNKLQTSYKKDHAIVFQGGLFYDQAERIPIMDGFISMKRRPVIRLC